MIIETKVLSSVVLAMAKLLQELAEEEISDGGSDIELKNHSTHMMIAYGKLLEISGSVRVEDLSKSNSPVPELNYGTLAAMVTTYKRRNLLIPSVEYHLLREIERLDKTNNI